MAQLVFLSSFVCWKRLTGFSALDCWFGRQLEWERWLAGWLLACSLKQKPAGRQEAADLPTSKSRSGADSENKIECKETTSRETGNGFGKEKERKRSCRWIADVLTSSGEVHGVLSIIVDLNRLG